MIEKILELLENVAHRPAMYLVPLTPASALNFLNGLKAGCWGLGLDVSHEHYVEAASARGWQHRATGIVWHMEERGLSEAEIIQELIAIEADAFRRTAAGSKS